MEDIGLSVIDRPDGLSDAVCQTRDIKLMRLLFSLFYV